MKDELHDRSTSAASGNRVNLSSTSSINTPFFGRDQEQVPETVIESPNTTSDKKDMIKSVVP